MVKVKGYNKEFDICLTKGEIKEEWLNAGFSEGDTIEVKTDFKAHKTGNIAIEVSSFGKPSGLVTTTSKYWYVHLAKKDFGIMVKTEKLRSIIRAFVKEYPLSCDWAYNDNTSNNFLILIPVKELFTRLIQ